MSTQYTIVETAPASLTTFSSKPKQAAPKPSWRPYMELTRFSKPAGLLGVYFPYFIGFLYSVNLTNPKALSGIDWVKLSAVFLLDGLILRSFGCAWNDTVDQDLDRQVERCKKRPLARGAITTPDALATTLILAVSRHVLFYATLPTRAAQHALFTTVLGLVYPFMKRFSNFPQLCLGLGVGWAVFLVDAVVVDGAYEAGPTTKLDVQDRTKAMLAMFACQSLFNITYDTVYAFQDIQDDLKAGVGSLAIAVRYHPKVFLLSIASAMAGFLWATVSWGGLNRGPFLIGAGLSSLAAFVMLARLNVWDPRRCRDFFVNSQWWVSGVLVMGLVAQEIFTVKSLDRQGLASTLLVFYDAAMLATSPSVAHSEARNAAGSAEVATASISRQLSMQYHCNSDVSRT
ncbi:prenyltransferase family [Stemphylium lycopersici]|uniref:Prenyltransferase family n=1 Tax=Stemphylium lycopersici TaxID=183478 RepID=A0A364NF63_STELY|nr:prenyltransferase family [Stemphylium lycopersici]RAR15857.1 prenyltransferase family [Stemphylium lycopersici]